MHKDLVKFRKTLASLTCSPLILISNNLELAAKYLPNKEEEPIRYKTNEEDKNNLILGDEISPDNCRLWDLNQKNDTIVSLDKDRFRNDLGGLIEAYSEINRRINEFI